MAKVKDILARKGDIVVTIGAAETVADAARLMNERGIGGRVVMDRDQMVGIFTERVVLRRVVAEKRDPAATPVREVMTSPVVTCGPDAPLEQCVELVTSKRIRHIPVLDEGQLCGIITSGDMLAFQVQEQQDTIEHLNRYVFDVR